MAGALYFRLWDLHETATMGGTTKDEKIVDAGAYRQVVFSIFQLSGGTGTVYIDHAAAKDDKQWAPLATIALSATPPWTEPEVASSDAFLRFLRARVMFGGTPPVLLINGVAKP